MAYTDINNIVATMQKNAFQALLWQFNSKLSSKNAKFDQFERVSLEEYAV